MSGASRSRGPHRLLAAGAALVGVGVASFVAFVVVAVGWDNRVSQQWVLAVAAYLLVPVGLLTLAVGTVWRLAVVVRTDRDDARAVVREMDRAASPAAAVAVQARAVRMSLARMTAIAAVLAPVLVLVLGGRARGLLLVPCLVLGAVGLAALTGWRPTRWPGAGRRGADLAPYLADRATAMAALAAEHGWTYQDVDRRAAADGTARNSLLGTDDGIPFLVFDRIRTASRVGRDGRAAVSPLTTATVVQVAFPAAFRLAVVPAAFGAGARWGHFGGQVELESGAFNDAYEVYCLDPYRARLVLNPAVMDRLARSPGLELLVDRGLLRLTLPHALADVATVPALVGLTTRVARSARAADVT